MSIYLINTLSILVNPLVNSPALVGFTLYFSSIFLISSKNISGVILENPLKSKILYTSHPNPPLSPRFIRGPSPMTFSSILNTYWLYSSEY